MDSISLSAMEATSNILYGIWHCMALLSQVLMVDHHFASLNGQDYRGMPMNVSVTLRTKYKIVPLPGKVQNTFQFDRFTDKKQTRNKSGLQASLPLSL